MVLAAGAEKFVSHAAFVGVHGASDGSGRETIGSGAATVSMARTLKDLGVPEAIIGKMVVTPPDEMVWLSVDDLRSMGARVIDRPLQAPRGGLAQPPPLQLERSADDMGRMATTDGRSALSTKALAAADRKDYATALRIWRRLAEAGDAASQYNVAQLYYSGRGVAQNLATAAGWYRRAAEQGLPDAQLNLGIACALGLGVPQDLIEAYQWLELAADSFATEEQRERAVRTRDLIALRMVPEQVARARRLVRDRIAQQGQQLSGQAAFHGGKRSLPFSAGRRATVDGPCDTRSAASRGADLPGALSEGYAPTELCARGRQCGLTHAEHYQRHGERQHII